jgi:hypothetical protein
VSLSLIMRGIYPQLSQETMSLIHSSAWKGNSRKFTCKILHRSALRDPRIALRASVLGPGGLHLVVLDRYTEEWKSDGASL